MALRVLAFIYDRAGELVSAAAIHFCHFVARIAIDDMQMREFGWVPVKLCEDRQASCIWPREMTEQTSSTTVD